MHMANFTIGSEKPHIKIIAYTVLNGAGYCGIKHLPVVRVNIAFMVNIVRSLFFRLQAKNPKHFIRPIRNHYLRVIPPTANMSYTLSFLQNRLIVQ